MKHFFTLFTLLGLTSLAAFAQVSITTADLPSVGISKQVAVTANPSISVGEPSTTAQTWNFTNVVSDAVSTVSFANTEGTPSPADYPNSTITRVASLGDLLGVSLDALGIPVNLDAATAYYKIGSDGHLYTDGINVPINIAGIVDLGNQSIASEPDDLYLPALSLGNSVSVSGHYEKELSITDPLPITATISIDAVRTVTADAFGTLQLFGQSYEVLRYNEILNAHLNADASILGTIDTNLTIRIVRFMSPGQGFPVASVTVEELESGSIATRIEYIFTGDNPQVGIADLSAQQLLRIAPNPADNVCYLSLDRASQQQVCRTEVYNALGQLMWQGIVGDAPMAISTEKWAAGLYHCQIVEEASNQVIATQRLVIAR